MPPVAIIEVVRALRARAKLDLEIPQEAAGMRAQPHILTLDHRCAQSALPPPRLERCGGEAGTRLYEQGRPMVKAA